MEALKLQFNAQRPRNLKMYEIGSSGSRGIAGRCAPFYPGCIGTVRERPQGGRITICLQNVQSYRKEFVRDC